MQQHALIARCHVERLRHLLGFPALDVAQEDDLLLARGQLGDRALVTKNHLASADGNRERSFTIGIRMHPLKPIVLFNQLWLVDFNVAPSRQQTVLVSNGAEEERNVPAPPPT